MNILFVLRSDAGIKGGGDLVQAVQYKKVLAAKDKSINICFSHELTSGELTATTWDVVQVFNISRLYENIQIVNGINYKKLILTPILQPGFGFSLKLKVKSLIKYFLLTRKFIRFFDENEFLNKFDAFVFLSDSERQAFYDKFPATSSIPYAIFHNGVDITPEGDVLYSQKRMFNYIIVGRIEPKKRVVEAIDTVNAIDLVSKIICVGGLNWYSPVYCIKFLYRILCGKAIYVGKQPPEVVHFLMRNSAVLLNFSELEVSPLVDLEALHCGCKVISTDYSYSHLLDSDYFIKIDVKNNKECFDSIKNTISANRNKLSPESIPSWSDNSEHYMSLLNRLVM